MGLIFFVGPVTGKLINRFGCRIVAIFGALLNALGLFLSSFVTSLPLMFLTFSLLCGLGTSCVYTSSFMIVPRYFKTHRSLAVGIISSGLPLGIITATTLGNALLEIYHWRDVFKITAGIALGACLLVLTFDPNVNDSHEVTEMANDSTGFSFFKSKRYVVFLVTAMVSYVPSYIPLIHLVSHLNIPVIHLVRRLNIPVIHLVNHLNIPVIHQESRLNIPVNHPVSHLNIPVICLVSRLNIPVIHLENRLNIPVIHLVSYKSFSKPVFFSPGKSS